MIWKIQVRGWGCRDGLACARLIHLPSDSPEVEEASWPSGLGALLGAFPCSLELFSIADFQTTKNLSGCPTFGRMAGSPRLGSSLRKHLEQKTAVGFVHTHTLSSQPGAWTLILWDLRPRYFPSARKEPWTRALSSTHLWCTARDHKRLLSSCPKPTPFFERKKKKKKKKTGEMLQTISEQCHVWRKTSHANNANFFFF